MSGSGSKTAVSSNSLRAPEYGDLLVSYLEQLGVEYVFGIPGGAIEPFYNALARSERRGGPRAVIARHETGAAFMADGYARNTGKLGVVCSTTGPGATNMVTGVASAYENHVPMLVITAQTAISSFGRGAFQDSSGDGVDIVNIYQSITRYNSLVSHATQLEHKFVSALMSALGSPMGPAHLSIPKDVLESPVVGGRGSYDLPALLNRPALVDEMAVRKLADTLIGAKKPVFIIGEEASIAIGDILDLAVRCSASILVTQQGKGLVSPYHPLFKGVYGFAGHQTATDMLADPEVDVVVAAGVRFGEFAGDGWDPESRLGRKLIHVESIEANLTRTPIAALHVRGSLDVVFSKVLKKCSEEVPLSDTAKNLARLNGGSFRRHFKLENHDAFKSDASPIKPQRLMRELPRLFPPNTRYLADPGNSITWGIHYLHPFDRRLLGRREKQGPLFSTSVDFASMGWGIGSAVGTALGCPGTPVVCIAGDGSMLMSGSEITVAIQEKLPLIYVILNDSSLGMVRHGQALTGAEPIGTKIPEVDFALCARAMGVPGYVITSPEELLDLDIEAICQRKGPTVLDVRIDPSEVPPMGHRTDVLKDTDQ